MPVMMITGSSRGIGRYLTEYYLQKGYQVVGCSRGAVDEPLENYQHFCLDISDEDKVRPMFGEIRRAHGRLDVLINNAGIASMNHVLVTPVETVRDIFETNVVGTFLFCREAAKLMRKQRSGRIVNLVTVAAPLRLEGEAAYASSKAAVVTLTRILARELADFGITVNALGPAPTRTDLIRSVPDETIRGLLDRQAIHRFSELTDISNVTDFFIRPESDFVTGQTIFLGGV